MADTPYNPEREDASSSVRGVAASLAATNAFRAEFNRQLAGGGTRGTGYIGTSYYDSLKVGTRQLGPVM